jgi:hypothetical protein
MIRRWPAPRLVRLMLAAVVLLLAVAGRHSPTLVAFAAIGACAVLGGRVLVPGPPRRSPVDRTGVVAVRDRLIRVTLASGACGRSAGEPGC